MSVIIRPAVQSDIPYLYSICLKTGDSGKDATDLFHDPYLIGQFYAAPYLFYDISLCFIAEEKGIPKGYIVATENTLAYNAWRETNWFPPLRRRYAETSSDYKIRSENESKLLFELNQPKEAQEEKDSWLSQYPAHLHIDILSDLQGKGCGRSLIETLLCELKKRDCPGIHFGVNSKNTGAIAFYKKTGFLPLVEEDWGLIMGKKIL